MSLDVYLEVDEPVKRPSGSGVFIREHGATREISRSEWEATNPGREPVVVKHEEITTEVFSANITHNLGGMAKAAGIYDILWRPDELGITTAGQLISALEAGWRVLMTDPKKFEQYNPPNGWGDYAGLCRFVKEYLKACISYPEAKVRVSR